MRTSPVFTFLFKEAVQDYVTVLEMSCTRSAANSYLLGFPRNYLSRIAAHITVPISSTTLTLPAVAELSITTGMWTNRDLSVRTSEQNVVCR